MTERATGYDDVRNPHRWAEASFPPCGCIVVGGLIRYPCATHKPPKIDRRRKPRRVMAA